MRVLVLDAHSNASLCVLQRLARAGHETRLAGSDPGSVAWSSRYAREKLIYPDPLRESDGFKQWVGSVQERRDFDFIIPVTDHTIYPMMEFRRESGLGKVLVLPTEDSFPWVFNKAKTNELARSVDVPVPETEEISSSGWAPERFSAFPYFVKPVQSKVWGEEAGEALQPRLARDADELRRGVERFIKYGVVSVQRYVRGAGAGVGVLCDGGEVLTSFAYRRVHEYPLTGGASTYRVSTAMPEELLEATRRMLGRIGWTGVAMVEFKRSEDGYCLMEINGRFWGSLPLAVFSGVDFPGDLIDLLSGKRRPAAVPYRIGLYVRKPATDLAWFKQNLRADKSDPFLLTRPVMVTLLEGSRILIGRERWDHASWRDPRPILTILFRAVSNEIRLRLDQLRVLAALRGAGRQTRRVLRRGGIRRILVLCHGNICRSPLVERYLLQITEAGELEVRSAGFHPRAGRTSPDLYRAVAADAGVPLNGHRSTVVDREMIGWAEAIVIMDRENWRQMHEYDRAAMPKVVWLGCAADGGGPEIEDPYGKREPRIRKTVDRLKRCTEVLASRLVGGAGKRQG